MWQLPGCTAQIPKRGDGGGREGGGIKEALKISAQDYKQGRHFVLEIYLGERFNKEMQVRVATLLAWGGGERSRGRIPILEQEQHTHSFPLYYCLLQDDSRSFLEPGCALLGSSFLARRP